MAAAGPIAMAATRRDTMEYILRHFILPPKPPQADDAHPVNEKALLQTTTTALRNLQNNLSTTEPVLAQIFESPISAIENFLRNHNANGYIEESELATSLRNLADDADSKSVPLHVRAQNACILVSRREEYILFDVFELSPQDDRVMQIQGRLVRSFPNHSCLIHKDRLLESGLIEALASHIARLSCSEVAEFRFGSSTPTHPGLVTDHMVSVLSALGAPTTPISITKHTREEVNYSPGGSPWRRSPIWLLVRVVLQLEFVRSATHPTLARQIYKAALAHLFSTVLEDADKETLDPELLHIASTKINRRLRKLQTLDDDLSQTLINPVRTTLISLHQKWDTQREETMRNTDSDIDMSVLLGIEPTHDTQMDINKLDKFLRLIGSRKTSAKCSSFEPASECPQFDDVELLFALDEAGEHRYFQLLTVENWVREKLQFWLDAHKYEKKSCRRLSRLMMAYHRAAESLYSQSDAPRSLSVMYITIVELWIACDICACLMYPLLSEYSPEINLLPLQSLSLLFKSQMKRLLRIEFYAESREKKAEQNLPSVFRQFGHEQSFSVRYFDSSETLQDLQSQIERYAENKQQQKIEELKGKKKEYYNMLAEVDKLSCSGHETVYRGRGLKRKAVERTSKCKKCQLRQKAEKLSIEVYEQPLGSSESDAKSLVFEVNIPEAYSYWRDATVYLSKNVLLSDFDKDQGKKASSYTLSNYAGLKHFLKGPSSRRIGVYSSRKPALGTKKPMKIGVQLLTDEDVCVENDLRYRYYDDEDKYAMEKLMMSQKVQKRCTCKVPSRSPQLQGPLCPTTSPNHATPNSVMASISGCPRHISIDQYKTLGLLPLGNRVRYINILTQLRASTVDFTKSEVHGIIYHMTHMAGPRSRKKTNNNIAIAREAHGILHDVVLCNAILEEIDLILRKTQGNWEAWRSLAICVLLVLRILALTETPETMSRCFEHLLAVRHIAFGWVQSLGQRLRTDLGSAQRTELTSKRTEIALLCITTFDVDVAFINNILHDPEALSILLQTSIIIRENKETVTSDYEYLYQANIQSWRNLLFRSSRTIQDGLISGAFQASFNSAVEAAWEPFQPSGDWDLLDEPKHHWAHISSGPDEVHFNFLTADLLVNGLPLDRLPDEYTGHETYKTLFKSMPLEVMPTNEPGMAFSTKHTISDYKLSFGLDKQRQYMLVTASKDGEKLELIPQRVFEGSLPDHFVKNYVHWFNYDTEEIIFRNLDKPWTTTSDAWYFRKIGLGWQLQNLTSTLVAPDSRTGGILSKVFDHLQHSRHIHITIDNASSLVSIELIRLRLSFSLLPGESSIQSCQYSGYIIDSNQRIGTLIGLKSKLVLREENKGKSRMILIPEGTIGYAKKPTHMSVWIEPESIEKIHNYYIDSDLGHLKDNGSLQSKYLLCYLHALTAHFKVDKLIGLTGTEAALSILRLPAASSFRFLDSRNIGLLSKIDNLSPGRKFHPSSLKSSQQVSWDEQLPILSQHSAFHIEVERLFRLAKTNLLLHPKKNQVELPELRCVESNLLVRDDVRSSIFRTDGFGAECFTQQFDTIYSGRETLDFKRSQRASNMVKMLTRENMALFCKMENLQLALNSKHLKDSLVKGPGPLEPKTLLFVADWLSQPSRYLPRYWCSLHTALSASPNTLNKFTVMMFLSTLAFAEGADTDVLQTLAAFYRVPALARVSIPQVLVHHFDKGHKPELADIVRTIHSKARMIEDCPEESLPQQPGELGEEFCARRSKEFGENQENAIVAFASALHSQWPCERPEIPYTQNANRYINTESAMEEVWVSFKQWHDNYLFQLYINDIANVLNHLPVVGIPTTCKQSSIPPQKQLEDNKTRSFSAKDIFLLKAPVSLQVSAQDRDSIQWPTKPGMDIPIIESTVRKHAQENDGLNIIFNSLDKVAVSKMEKQYVADLRESRKSLGSGQRRVEIIPTQLEGALRDILQSHLKDCEKHFQKLNSVLRVVVRSNDDIACDIDHSPRTPPSFWLQQLHRHRYEALPAEWKKIIIDYALSITEIQRARRLVDIFDIDPDSLPQELLHEGHTNWSPEEFPETLLLEVEVGFLVREVQEDIAKHMRDPPGGRNSVLQLNCGAGKSSFIVPMVAAALADGNSLARIVVGKSQYKQMEQTLLASFGSHRQIYHMPFTRSLKLTAKEANAIGELLQECIRQRGVLLVQPEHILSFKLMVIESIITGNNDLGQSLLRLQDLFESVSRDIVDEADEIFSVRYELCYTMGTQKPIDLSPERWNIIHIVLKFVKDYAMRIAEKFPGSIEVTQPEGGRYPRVRLLRKEAEDLLLDLITEKICKKGYCYLPIGRLTPDIRGAVADYIRYPNPSKDTIRLVEGSRIWNESTKSQLLLMRGLIAGGILRFALTNKRWKVNYGLDTNRCPGTKLAVPYRSKDKPSARSEFSHPDVVIVLTSLTYYYDGLDDEDLFIVFVHLLRSDQRDIQYQNWVRDAHELPESFHYLGNINIEDRYQCITEIFPSLRYSKAVIDYFLSRIVFSKEIREFPSKLSTSGWDLGSIKANPTVGFSGTNDSRYLLPLDVCQLDLEAQKCTNALVLQQCIIQPDASQPQNTVMMLTHRTPDHGAQTGGEYLLSIVSSMNESTKVILDVGAQIIELDNFQVAQKWLAMTTPETARAALFFNDEEDLLVVDRNGRVEALQISPFSKRLDECLVYLDEAHTRGIDLRLPKSYRAAVTLGPNLTKDRFVQACMRMRELGKGQSLVFCIHEEIQAKILECSMKTTISDINVSDVVLWTMRETCEDLRRSAPLWASQGRQYEKHKDLICGVNTTKQQAEAFLEDEAQSLETRYRPYLPPPEADSRGQDIVNENLKKIDQRCRDFGSTNSNSAAFQEEQERELAPEVEEERQIERPAPAEPAEHTLHTDLQRLVDEGVFTPKSRTFIPAFKALKNISVAKSFDVDQFPTGLMVTQDYIHSIERPFQSSLNHFVTDAYHKPVQWILSVRAQKQANPRQADIIVVISPFEADQMLEQIRRSKYVTLHTYAPRIYQTHKPLDTLDLYTIGRPFNSTLPRALIAQLNLFAGQLYFSSYEEYVEMCGFLGLSCFMTGEGQNVQPDGFIQPPSGVWKLRESPVRFLKDLVVKIRREGQGIEMTHLGRMLEGEILERKDFETVGADDSLFIDD